jgi:murein DD-endopeptidase MepM/ murein hydrolase activator NlpD
MRKNNYMIYHPPLLPMPDIPVAQHCGAYGVRRKFDVHSGVDLYAPHGEPVYAVEDGVVVYVGPFTGQSCNTPWWNDTRALYVLGETATIVYGEIREAEGLIKGSEVKMGEQIGTVLTVLKKDKGKPMSMLHFAMKHKGYDLLYDQGIYTMNIDPTPLLIQCRINYLQIGK